MIKCCQSHIILRGKSSFSGHFPPCDKRINTYKYTYLYLVECFWFLGTWLQLLTVILTWWEPLFILLLFNSLSDTMDNYFRKVLDKTCLSKLLLTGTKNVLTIVKILFILSPPKPFRVSTHVARTNQETYLVFLDDITVLIW